MSNEEKTKGHSRSPASRGNAGEEKKKLGTRIANFFNPKDRQDSKL